ncbi:MAG: acyl-CoA dehydrogenase family protein, partial [Alteromonadaceae bacterium]|nr:acyl-CoA dehydrogenase family protein [Alteromonadaceae bacterium]
MDFNLTEDQQAFADVASQFAAASMAPYAAEWDANHTFPRDTIRQAGELGFCGLYTPEEAGGLGLSRLDSSVIFEQLAMGCTTTTAMLTIHNMATWMIATWGTSAVKDNWVADLVSGEKLASYCLTEPGAGSDAASLSTRAVKQDNGYQLNGSKVFISGAGSTDMLVVMARTSDDGAKGISAFAVPADMPGIVYGKAEEKMGWNAQPTRMITFDNVTVPADHLLGAEGQGFSFAMKGLDGGRINIA